MQNHLRRQTDACVRQAVSLTGFTLPESREERPPANIIEFLNLAKCQGLEARVDVIFSMLPDINHLFGNFHVVEGQRPQIGGIVDRKLRVLGKKIHKMSKRIREQLDSAPLREERFSKSAEGDSVHPKGLSTLASFTNTSQSPDLTDSSSDSLLSSDSTNRNSADPMTDSNTFTSTSKVKELDNDLEPFEIFESHQYLHIQGSSGRNDESLALFDSGTKVNFIISSAVKKHGLETHPLPNGRETFSGITKSRVYVDKQVTFLWQLVRGKKWRQATFRVVDWLPDGLRVVVGETTSKKEGFCIRVQQSSLVAVLEKTEG